MLKLLIIGFSLTLAASAATVYSVTAVPALAGAAMTGIAGTTPSGLLVGTDGTMTDVGFLPLGFTATGLTNSGQITGKFVGQIYQGFPGTSYFQTYFYDGSGWYGLNNPYVSDSTSAAGMDASGALVASAATGYGTNHTIVWRNDGTWIDLNTLGAGYWDMTPGGMNASGQVTGTADGRAFVYNGTTLQTLATLSGGSSTGNAINSSGQVTGSATVLGGAQHAFFTNSLQNVVDIGTLGGLNSAGLGMNTIGSVVGWAETLAGVQHGFIYTGGNLTDLNDLLVNNGGWTIQSAIALNNSGIILATAINLQGFKQTVLLTPTVPEPSSWMLLGSGLLFCAFMARRRRTLAVAEKDIGS